jgi:hypothetical protein
VPYMYYILDAKWEQQSPPAPYEVRAERTEGHIDDRRVQEHGEYKGSDEAK